MEEGRRRKASRVRASSVALFKGSAGRGTAAVRVFIIRLLRCCACAMAALAARSLAHGSRQTECRMPTLIPLKSFLARNRGSILAAGCDQSDGSRFLSILWTSQFSLQNELMTAKAVASASRIISL